MNDETVKTEWKNFWTFSVKEWGETVAVEKRKSIFDNYMIKNFSNFSCLEDVKTEIFPISDTESVKSNDSSLNDNDLVNNLDNCDTDKDSVVDDVEIDCDSVDEDCDDSKFISDDEKEKGSSYNKTENTETESKNSDVVILENNSDNNYEDKVSKLDDDDDNDSDSFTIDENLGKFDDDEWALDY